MDTPNPFARDCPNCSTFRAQLALARDAWNRLRSTGRYIAEPDYPENDCSACGGTGLILTPSAHAFKEHILAELDARWAAAKKGGAA
jgi:hypothetical protein